MASHPKPFGAETLQDEARFVAALKVSHAKNFGKQQAAMLDALMHSVKIQEH